MKEQRPTQDRVRSAENFLSALSRKSVGGLRDAFAADIRFRGLTPSRAWEANGADEAIEILLGSWFEATDHIDEMVSHDAHEVVDRIAVRYRFKVHNDDGEFVVEQQAILVIDDNRRITDASIVCSGFRPFRENPEAAGRPPRHHRFDPK